ncbi:MAG: protein kinase domain-containing protein [Pseudanabaenaceae cyanobacterium]
MEIYCTRPSCGHLNVFPELAQGNTLKTAQQKFCVKCGMPLILGGRYLPEKPLARGGFGATYVARDRYTPAMRRCVVKQLQPTGLTPDQMKIAQAMFEREGAVLEELGRHPNIPDLLAFFPVQAGQEEYFYLVQEFINGLNLQEVIEQHGPLSEAELREILGTLLPVLQFVHDRGSIHRDIKPANIMVSRDTQEYYLLDFGAVKQVTAAGHKKSTGIFTPGYAPPEQMRGDTVFPASDLYALGVTCICLLTGKNPEDLFDPNTNNWHWQGFLPAPISPNLEAVLTKMLMPAANQRYASAQEALAALQPAAATLPPPPTPAAVPAPLPTPAAPPPLPTPAPVRVQRQPQPLRLPALGPQLFGAFVLGTLGGFLGMLGLALVAQFGPVSAVIPGSVFLMLLILRSLGIADNKDVLVFGGIFVALLLGGAQVFLKVTLPPLLQLFPWAAIAGAGLVFLTAFGRLVYQLLWSLF